MSATSNRDAAGANLKAIALAGIAADDETSPFFAAAAALGFAMLDVADAIREQTDALKNDGVVIVP